MGLQRVTVSSRGLTWVTRRHSWLQRVTGFTEGYRGLQRLRGGYKGLQRTARKCRGLPRLPVATKRYPGVQTVTRSYSGF